MRHFKKPEPPAFLLERGNAWAQEWASRCHTSTFNWHEYDGEKVNHKILATLQDATQDHCSFCDAYPVSPPSDNTIEHFKPKAQYPLEAYSWDNLFFCCRHCQQKGAPYSPNVLKPDEVNYKFTTYFIWDFITGEILPNPSASAEEQTAASYTINYFRLNTAHPQHRRRFRTIWLKLAEPMPIDQFPYRNFITTDLV